jgi:hypothetical protein
MAVRERPIGNSLSVAERFVGERTVSSWGRGNLGTIIRVSTLGSLRFGERILWGRNGRMKGISEGFTTRARRVAARVEEVSRLRVGDRV